MPVRYSLIQNLLRLEFEGEYAPVDVSARFLEALSDPACPAKVALLVDVTSSAVFETRQTEQIRLVAEFLGPYAERIGGRCAVLATRDIHFGLARMGAAYTEGVGVEAGVFRSLEEALTWLGVGHLAQEPEVLRPSPRGAPTGSAPRER